MHAVAASQRVSSFAPSWAVKRSRRTEIGSIQVGVPKSRVLLTCFRFVIVVDGRCFGHVLTLSAWALMEAQGGFTMAIVGSIAKANAIL